MEDRLSNDQMAPMLFGHRSNLTKACKTKLKLIVGSAGSTIPARASRKNPGDEDHRLLVFLILI